MRIWTYLPGDFLPYTIIPVTWGGALRTLGAIFMLILEQSTSLLTAMDDLTLHSNGTQQLLCIIPRLRQGIWLWQKMGTQCLEQRIGVNVGNIVSALQVQ